MAGNDLFFVAGGLGIAPLRSLINYVMDNRKDFGKVDILLGCRTPQDMLFGDEVDLYLIDDADRYFVSPGMQFLENYVLQKPVDISFSIPY